MPKQPTRESTRRPTLLDVAREAGVSQSTTSRALSGEGYVASSVRVRVLAAADRLGYVPHALASGLRKRSTRSIGVLLSDLGSSFNAQLANGIGVRAERQGFTMSLAYDRGSLERQLTEARALIAARVSGVIVTPLSAEVSTYLKRQGVPVVELDHQFAAGLADAVVSDNRAASRRAVEELVLLGHRRIAMLIDDVDWTTGSERLAGYREALNAHGLPSSDELVEYTGRRKSGGKAATQRLLSLPDPPTAIFAGNEGLAEGAWRAVSERGLRIPGAISLISFDDAPWMSMVTPAVTAISQDPVALGEAAFDRVAERIDNPLAPVRTVVLAARMISRGSTGQPEARFSAPSGEQATEDRVPERSDVV